MLKIENYFKPSNVKETLVDTVWGELSLAYDELTMSLLEEVDKKGRQWHKIKIKKFIFLNIVRHLSKNCDIHTLSCTYSTDLKVLNTSDHAGYYECSETKPSFKYLPKWYYERDFIWGGLYFVLIKLKADEKLLEQIRKVANYRVGNNTIHFFEKWVEAANDTFSNCTDESKVEQRWSVKESKTIFLYLTKFKDYYTEYNSIEKNPYIPSEIREKFISPRIVLILECIKELGWQSSDLVISPLPDKYPSDYLGTNPNEIDKTIGRFICEYFPHLYKEELFPMIKEQCVKTLENEDVQNPKTHFKYFTDKATIEDWNRLLQICSCEKTKGKIAALVRCLIDLHKEDKISKIYEQRKEVLSIFVKHGLPNDESSFNSAIRSYDTDKLKKLFS